MTALLSDEECYCIVEKYLEGSNFTLLDCQYRKKDGDAGFIGIPGFTTIRFKEHTKEEVTTVNFFVKQLPRGNPELEEITRAMNVFYKESELYERILGKLNEIAGGEVLPRYYFSRPDDILVLQDLSELGFCTKDTHDIYDLDHCEGVLRCLAKFHASSFIYEERNKTTIDKVIPELLFETLFVDDPKHPSFDHICVSINALESLIDAYFSHVPSKVCKGAVQLLRSLLTSLNPSKKHRNVLTHGDLWANNIMFKYSDSGKVEDVRFVDFQLMRYGAPAFDVLFLIYINTTNPFRQENMEPLLTYYYNQLGKELLKADLKISEIITWNDFRSSIKEELPKVLSIAPIYLHYFLLPKQKLEEMMKDPELYKRIVHVDWSDLVLDQMQTNENYHTRVSQSLSDLIQCVQNH